MIVSGGGESRHINGIQSLLIKKNYPGMVDFRGVREPPYTWSHFLSVNEGALAAKIKSEFWVSLMHDYFNFFKYYVS